MLATCEEANGDQDDEDNERQHDHLPHISFQPCAP